MGKYTTFLGYQQLINLLKQKKDTKNNDNKLEDCLPLLGQSGVFIGVANPK